MKLLCFRPALSPKRAGALPLPGASSMRAKAFGHRPREASAMANAVKRSGPPAVPRVALLIETTGSAGCDILRGVARYAREGGPWALRHEPRAQQFTEGWVPSWLDAWEGHGILGRFETD